jgi:hypothetical protein
MSKLIDDLWEWVDALEKGDYEAARPRLSDQVLKVEALQSPPLDPVSSEPVGLWCGNVPKFWNGVIRKNLIPKSDMEIWKAISK